MKIRYRPTALAEIDAIFSHIAARNQPAAHRVMHAIRHSIERLSTFPYSARRSQVSDIRELAIVRYPYVVFYAVDDVAQEVHILRVRHTSRKPVTEV